MKEVFAPNLESSEQALDLLVQAIEQQGIKQKKRSRLRWIVQHQKSIMKMRKSIIYGESMMAGKEIRRNSEEMVQYYEKLVEDYRFFQSKMD